MNKEMMEAMSLEGGDQAYQDNPEAPIAVPDQTGQMVEMDPTAMAAEGMTFAYRDMRENGPTHPSHSIADRERGLDVNKMTKAQLREQKMNEEEGYPSNLDEAQRVKELEGKVQNIESGISQILSHLQGVPPSGPERMDRPEGPVLLNPAGQSSPASTPQSVPTGGSPVSPVAAPIQTPGPSVTVPPPNPPSIASSESTEPENKQPKLRQVTLKDGRKISVPQISPPAMNLGPVPEQKQVPNYDGTPCQRDSINFNDDGYDGNWDEPIAKVPEPEQDGPPDDPGRVRADMELAKTQQLVQDVNDFMRGNDVHRFWRRHLGQKVHRHVGYNGWPQKLQIEFDNRFKGFLCDPQFVTSVCRKVISMEMGHVLGAKWVTSFLVATAGFTAFALCGLDG
jgi:hypothetical protein